MIPPDCKRLAEVDFPIAEVSRHAVREKSIRHGHPSTLHLWWARRPLASSRAILLALLLPDPADPSCPAAFKDEARELLPPCVGPVGPTDDELRQKLLRFVGQFANWDLVQNEAWLQCGRDLVKAAHPEDTPLIADPFAGGGSIPLEALRLGCDAFASDLNPVACLILKVLLEGIPRCGPALADELRQAGAKIKESVEKELGQYYPPDPDRARPIAYIWARTVRCEAPRCGAEIPLIRSFWLAKKEVKRRESGGWTKVRGRQALRHVVERPQDGLPRLRFEVFEPTSDEDVPRGTVVRARATCPCCDARLAPDRVRVQLREQRGGADVLFDDGGRRIGGAMLLAVVTLGDVERGRRYRIARTEDYRVVHASQQALVELDRALLPSGLRPIPDEPSPVGGGRGASRAFSVYAYGMTIWGDLFTARQKLAIASFTSAVVKFASPSTQEVLALMLGRLADRSSALCRWRPDADQEKVENVFSRQALSTVWDFAEAVPTSASTGSWTDGLAVLASAVERISAAKLAPGTVERGDAADQTLPSDSAQIWFTDPPYYDAIPYADLSDFFFVWQKRTLPKSRLVRESMNNLGLTPKDQEAVQDETRTSGIRSKDRSFFEEKMAAAFAAGRRVIRQDGIGSVVFAHKTTEGWEALLGGMIPGGWVITGSWPIATESTTRLRAKDSAALATSVHLVCRPRTGGGIGDWAEVLAQLPPRVTEWMDRLEGEGIRGADLVFACIGPALEIFSRHEQVERPDGSVVPLAEYLEKVWEVVGRAALEQVLGTVEARASNGAAVALEEDARLTALFLWTIQSSTGVDVVTEPNDDETGDADDDDEDGGGRKPKGYTLVYDVVRRFAQPLGIHLDSWENRIIATHKGTVRLLPVAERAVQLFGEAGAEALADRIESTRRASPQLELFARAENPNPPAVRGRGRRGSVSPVQRVSEADATTLDRVHAAILLQASGRANALKALLVAETQRGRDFIRLANALSALYPRDSEEKRLLDAMLLVTPR